MKNLLPKMHISVLLILVLLNATATYAQWTNISGLPISNGASARIFAATFNDADFGYIAGGYKGAYINTASVAPNTLLKDVWQYNPKTNTWLQMPEDRKSVV